tara:strand:+ start:609 stop:773 length:165 start_codon:yes stop_codon:yes gene_type:complete
MNQSQVKWAASHDWHINSYKLSNGQLGVKVKDDMEAGVVRRFESFEELQDWAGY